MDETESSELTSKLLRVTKPTPRTGHVAVTVGSFMVIWGGYSYHQEFEGELYLPPNELCVYHTELEQWFVGVCDGEIPHGTSGAVALHADQYLYIVGGHNDFGNTADVYRLNLQTWKWELMQCNGQSIAPRDKFAAWYHDNKIYCFGGFGEPISKFLNDNGKFLFDDTVGFRGWNNQLCVFDLSNNSWSNPACKGEVPLPRAAQSCVLINNKVYLFGGRHDQTRLNDLHCLDLDTLTWSGLITTTGDIPEPRSWHSCTAIGSQTIFLYGGYSQSGQPLSDAFMYDIDSQKWTQMDVATDQPRLWHTACLTQDQDILVYGGCCSDILSNDEVTIHSGDLLTFRISPKRLVRICLETALHHKDILKKDWPTLPVTLCDFLMAKCETDDNSFSTRSTLAKFSCIIS